jgi:superfamily II RNA helicase
MNDDPIAAFAASLPFPLDPFQRQAMEALDQGKSVLVAAPTGTGKTVIAEFGVYLARRAGLKAVYTTPIKALSNQKFRDFKARYADEVGLVTGDVVVNQEGSILVMTTEVLRNMLVQGSGLDDVGVVVFDEVHYMGDPERGTAWEESILLAPKHIPFVCLSATVPNAAEIAAWLQEVHGDLECVFHDQRSVPLEVRYFLDGKGYTVLDAQGRRRAWFSNVGGELARRVRWGGAPGLDPLEPADDDREPLREPEPWEVLRWLEDQDLTPAIYFLFGRKACEVAALSCETHLKPVRHGAQLVREARARLAELPPEDRRLRQVALLFRLLPRGLAVHHAGMLPVIKMLVEELFASGRLRAVFATETLALGINVPARTVVLGDVTKWDGEMRRLVTPNEFRQLTGRAGRRGIDTRGVAMLLYSPWVSFQRGMEVAQGELLPLYSAFRPNYNTALNLWHKPGDEDRLADLYARSLRRLQHDVRMEELALRHTELQQAYADLASRDISDSKVWELAQELARSEHELKNAQREAKRESRRVADGLLHVLERFGYMSLRRPTRKAAYLRAVFDTNALTLAELLADRYLEGLLPEELAEVVSWFAFDSDRPVRGLPITPRLKRLREEVGRLHGEVLDEERRWHLEISQPLNYDFRGIAEAWAEGEELGNIAQRCRLAEGDVVGVLQKTIDVLSQLKDALYSAGRKEDEELLQRLRDADELMRRGVVESSYRWAVSGPPEPDGKAKVEAWEVPLLEDEEERRGPNRRQRRRASFGPRKRPAAAAGKKRGAEPRQEPPPRGRGPRPRRRRP